MKMSSKTKTREVTIFESGGAFSAFFKKFSGEKKEYDFDGIAALRKLLSNEKARLLHVIKSKKPTSLYQLAKFLKRDIKAVKRDIRLLERFGFIDLIAEKSGNREKLKPIVVVDALYINLKI